MTSDIDNLHTKVESILNDVDHHIDGIDDFKNARSTQIGHENADNGSDSLDPTKRAPDASEDQENINPLLNGSELKVRSNKSPQKKPVKFKVKKVNHEPDNDNVVHQHEQRKQLKLVELQYEQVVNRIRKIHKEVRFLKNLLPPYNLEIDYSTRVKIDNSIDKLLTRADELNKEKHHLGITLSRIWREFDDSDYWVRTASE